MASLAQYEAKMISKRTKAALAAAKARGVKLGKPENLTLEARQRGADSNHEAAKEYWRPLYGYMRLMRDNGFSYRKIAAALNTEGHRTRRSKLFNESTIYRILKRGNGG